MAINSTSGSIKLTSTKGFTLIELVIVIITLGVLAVIAAPKFINLQSDAKIATVQGVKAAIQSSLDLAYSRAAIDGVEKDDRSLIDYNGEVIEMKLGYPEAFGENDGGGLPQMLEIGSEIDFCFGSGSCTPNVEVGSSNVRYGYDLDDETINCHVRYIEPTGTGGSATTYTLTVDITGC
ncbi:prepilin-type N-terminal cleavage/methylation domain-containing protein [Shewanella japonica]|uniref:Type II secretion system protein G n=1 Tax=Shewanella japonica TaxID=93973 RepID=A0ABN4YF49_9GAMM|nr:prepilin-type N-terminal cleavage/methylation domain-containing protein [Shewanella japonica]ARD20935.1 Type II secretion system protein G precursor [Shewanella japonica]